MFKNTLIQKLGDNARIYMEKELNPSVSIDIKLKSTCTTTDYYIHNDQPFKINPDTGRVERTYILSISINKTSAAMQNTFQKVGKDLYDIDFEEINVVIKVKPDTLIVLDTPNDQYNPTNMSCLWYYKVSLQQEFPTRCIPCSYINYEILS